ncbi:SusC/RagA family TonB-linked outer membrane protein [Catalinimonas niigatensis]|uniref:SusC/RagA family TonB-linked outer membrane protein n=1 Tax=Catalinimonas niigatensis TaxID=1397264 RepID=UPI002665CBC3|nr:TonB-dependent receptor [Catalinimonas niigatensis]WPP51808.1 TonB-dependent receptor [Catalinimonas niigatensis]
MKRLNEKWPYFFWLLTLHMLFFSVQGQAQAVATNTIFLPSDPYQERSQDLSIVLMKLAEKFSTEFNYDKETISNKKVSKQLLKSLDSHKDLESTLQNLLSPLGLDYKRFEDASYVIYPQPERKKIEKLERKIGSEGTSQTDFQQEAKEILSSAQNHPLRSASFKLQQQIISGKVTDGKSGEGLPGVNVLAKGTAVGTVTGIDGNYRLTVEDEVTTLVFSSIGYLSQEIPINGRSVIDIALNEDVQSLEEVIVVGYSTKRQSELSSSVATVEAEELQEGVVSQDLGNMLQGKVSGLTISNSGGRPGDQTNIVIRGVGSIGAGYEPLYVVDGVIGGSANPMDIASVTVLKDAAATGLYGSRAANGVIIITTKSGQRGETKVNYTGSVGPTFHRYGNIDMMNSAELYDRQSAGFRNFYDARVAEGDPAFANIGFDQYLETVLPSSLLERDTDWQSLLTRTGMVNQHQLSVSGGNEKTTFYVSGNYYYERGTILNTYYRNLNLRTNFKHEISDRFTLHARINAGADKRPNEPLGGQEGTMAQFYNNVPWDPAFEEDGITPYNPSAPGNPWIGNARSNHFYNVNHQSDITTNTRFSTDLQLDAQITDWMSFSTTNRVSYLGSDWRQLLDRNHQLANFENGRISETVSKNYNLLTSNLLNMSHSFGDHNLSGILGQEYNYIDDSFTGAIGMDLANGLSALSAAGSPKAVSGNITETGFLSYFGQLDYNYSSKYFLVGSLRRDASSRFGANNRWATFYSLGASWNINKENFLSNSSWIDLLKIRGSYGTTGNANIAPYLSLGTYSFTTSSTYNGISGARPSRIDNPNLTWEMAYNANLGIEFNFLSRFNLELDIYNRVNKSLLQNVPLSAASGFTNQQRNVGSVRNRGVDITLHSVNVDRGLFRWETSFNVNINRNKVLELNNGEDIADGQMRIREGLPIRYFYMKDWAGVDPQTGDPLWVRWEDAEGNVIHGADKREPANVLTTNVYNQASNLFIRTAYPNFTGGIRSDIFYKNFSLSMLFNFAVGQSIYFAARERIDADNNSLNQNQMNLHEDWVRWEQPGDIATHPKLFSGGSASNGTSSRYLEDASFFRIQNIRLGYSLPNQVYKLSNLRFFTSVDYLAVFTNFSGADPDINMENSIIAQGANSARFSPTRKILLGLSFDF